MTADDIGLFEALTESIQRSQSIESLNAILPEIGCALNVGYISYHAIPDSIKSLGSPLIITNYPREWVDTYHRNDYFSIDPVVRFAPQELLPVNWIDLVSRHPETRFFFREAEGFGIGKHGLTIPIHSHVSGRALLTVSALKTDREWELQRSRILLIMTAIAPFFHNRARDLTEPALPSPNSRPLSPREVDCVRGLVHGCTPKQIAAQLDISDTMVRSHLHSARSKLGCGTVYEAVATAVANGLVSRM